MKLNNQYTLKNKISKKPVVIFFLLVLISFILASNILKQNPYIWLFLIGGIFGFLIINHPKTGIILIIVSLFLLNWLSQVVGLIPRQITWLPEVILIILLFKFLFISAFEKNLTYTYISYPILFLFILGIVSSFINSSSLIVALAGFRNYFKFFLFFYIVAFFEFDEHFFKKILKFLILLAFLQVPITIVQRFWYIGQASGDPIGGTLGSNTSGTLTLFLMGTISILFAFYLHGLIKRNALLFSIALLFIPMTLNETKITYFLFPALSIFILRKNLLKDKGLISSFILIILFGFIFIASYHVYRSIYVKNRNIELFNYNFVSKYVGKEYTKSGSLNRIAQVKFANRNITQQFNTALLGIGPGNASDSFFKGAVGYFYKKYPKLKIDSVFLGRIIWEYGYLGLAVFLFILFKLFILAERIYKNSSFSPFHKSIALGFEGMMFVLIIASIYSNSFLIDVLGYVFWFEAGYLQKVYLQIKSEEL